MRWIVSLVAASALLAGPAQGSVGTLSPDPQAEIRGPAIWVDGRPFFPIFSWAQCLPTVERTLEIGVNVFMGDHCDDLPGLAQAIHGRAYLLTPTWMRDLDGLPGRLGWFQPDEPDEYGIKPDQIPEKPVAPGKLTFITFTGHFADEMAQPSAEIGGKAAYPGYARKADVLGFDLYPLTPTTAATRASTWARRIASSETWSGSARAAPPTSGSRSTSSRAGVGRSAPPRCGPRSGWPSPEARPASGTSRTAGRRACGTIFTSMMPFEPSWPGRAPSCSGMPRCSSLGRAGPGRRALGARSRSASASTGARST